MNSSSRFHPGMRRTLIALVLANVWVLACGHHIDTSVQPSGDGALGGSLPLADGGDDGAPPAEVGPVATCTSAFDHDFTADLAASEEGWSVHPSTLFSGGITAYDNAGGVPDHLRLQGAIGGPAFLERPLMPGCDRATVRLHFQVITSESFDLLSISLGATPPLLRLVIRYDGLNARAGWVESDAISPTVPFGKNIKTSELHYLNLVVSRQAEVWATIDDDITTNGPPLITHPIDAKGVDPSLVRVGVDNAAAGPGNVVDLDTITVVPP